MGVGGVQCPGRLRLHDPDQFRFLVLKWVEGRESVLTGVSGVGMGKRRVGMMDWREERQPGPTGLEHQSCAYDLEKYDLVISRRGTRAHPDEVRI